jgi:hypothetical protein
VYTKPSSLTLLSYKARNWLYCLAASLGLVLVGCLMNAYEVNLFVFVVTFVMMGYLTWVGSEAIALVSVWIVSLMSIAAIKQLWFHGLPRPEFRFIPMSLLASWLFLLLIAWLLGRAGDSLRGRYASQAKVFPAFIGLEMVALTSGWQLYSTFLQLFSLP